MTDHKTDDCGVPGCIGHFHLTISRSYAPGSHVVVDGSLQHGSVSYDNGADIYRVGANIHIPLQAAVAIIRRTLRRRH